MIYTNYTQKINESLTINKDTPNDFYSTAEMLINDIAKKIENLPAYKGLNLAGTTLSNDKKFKKSLEKSISIINDMKSRKQNIFSNPYKFNTNLNINNLKTSVDPGQVSRMLFDVLKSNGFILMKDSKSSLKNLFTTKLFYKVLSDKSFIAVFTSVNYTTNYGALSSYTSIPINFRAVKNDEKSLRHLNIIESAIEPIDNISII